MTKYDFTWERSHLSPVCLENNIYKWEKTVVCGHTPQEEPILLNKLICIDTGCVYNKVPGLGKLTAIRLPSREIVQVTNPSAKRSLKNWLLNRI